MLLKADGVVDYLNVNITAKDFRKGFATGSGIFNLAGNTVKRFIISALSVHISLGTVCRISDSNLLPDPFARIG